MFDKENVLSRILSLDQLITTKQRKGRNSAALERFNSLIENIRGVGMVEGVVFDKDDGRYFLIDGASWQKACEALDDKVTPNFIMWEETDFFTFLESMLKGPDKKASAS